MYIEFSFNNIDYPALEQELLHWYNKHQKAFHLKILNQKVKLTFSKPEDYTYFCLTWDPRTSNLTKYLLIEPMKIDKLD